MDTLELYIKDADKLCNQELYEDAQKLLNNLLSLEPGYAKAHNYLGWLYIYHLVDQNLAEMHLNYALLFDPSLEEAYLNLADLLDEQDRSEEKIGVLHRALKSPKTDKGWIYKLLGNSYEMCGQYRSAIIYYRKSLLNTINNSNSDGLGKSILRVRKKQVFRLLRIK